MFKLKLSSDLEQGVHRASITNTSTDTTYSISHDKYLKLTFEDSFEDWMVEHLELDDADAEAVASMLDIWSDYIINNTMKMENEYA